MLCLKKTISCTEWSDQYGCAICEAVTNSNKEIMHVQLGTQDCVSYITTFCTPANATGVVCSVLMAKPPEK